MACGATATGSIPVGSTFFLRRSVGEVDSNHQKYYNNRVRRVFLKPALARSYFGNFKDKFRLTSKELASKFEVSTRTINDWERGVCSFPLKVAQQIGRDYKIALPDNFLVKTTNDMKSCAGKRGALARNKKFGNPGTLEGRIKGGRNSMATHRRLKTGFRIRKRFLKLRKTNELAEFIGIMLGDGNMTETQVRVTLSRRDEGDYAQYISRLMRRLFSKNPSHAERKGIIEIIISATDLVKRLQERGLVVGDKISNNAKLPDWVGKREKWIMSALKGLFDTDGSVYSDRHTISGKKYMSICVAYTSYSPPLLESISQNLELLGFSPTLSSKKRVMIRRRDEIVSFFRMIKPSNSKHEIRFRKLKEE